VGLNTDRGDVIEVVNMQFQGQAGEFEPGGGGGGPEWMGYLTQYGGRVLLFILAGILLFNLKRNLGRLVGEGFPAATGRSTRTGAGGRAGLAMGPAQDGGRSMEEDVKEYAAENPERVAEVLQTWLSEEE
jgi:flagellar biosynthesis/type III secretory pathway M-ring protein FliF/YscJ